MNGKEITRKAPAPDSRTRRAKVGIIPKGHKDTAKLTRENKTLRSRIALLESEARSSKTTRSKIGAMVNTSGDLTHEKKLTDAIVNSLPGIFYTLDFTGRFIRWNTNFERVTGYSGDEITAINALDLFAGEDRQRIAAGIQKVAETGEATVEAEILHKSGHGMPYLFTGRQVEIEGMPRLIGMGIDITERKQAQAQLQHSLDQMDLLLKVSSYLLYRCEAFGDFDATYISNNIEPILGYKTADFLQKGFWASNIHPEDPPVFLQDSLSFSSTASTSTNIDSNTRTAPGSGYMTN